MISTLRDKYDCEIGLSDHTLDETAALAAVSLGACAIEKHFILDRGEKGPDSEFSIEPKELAELKRITTQAWMALGKESFIYNITLYRMDKSISTGRIFPDKEYLSLIHI